MLDLKNQNIFYIYSLFIKNLYQGKFNRDLCLGVFYMTIHIIYILLIIYVTFFTFNLKSTCILFVMIYMNALTIYLLRTCPITLLEKNILIQPV